MVRWGVIGAGDIVRKRVAPAINDLPNCDLTAIARANADKAEEFAREFGAKRWYADWRELLGDDEIDAVSVRGGRSGQARALRKADGDERRRVRRDDRRVRG